MDIAQMEIAARAHRDEIRRLREENTQLKTKLARVVELHYAEMDSCETCGGYWPCLTYLAAKGE